MEKTLLENTPIVKTKFYRPPVTADLVARKRLLAQLNDNRRSPLTLVSAPAGYGKTTLVSNWLDTLNCANAWVTLDEYDNDLTQFLAYFLTALRSIFPGSVIEILALLNSSLEQPPIRVLINTLLNDLNQIESDYVLVLDDYHNIQEMEIHDLIMGLLRYPPPTMHLVLATRIDPPLELLNLRAKSRLNEVRVLELRFSRAEIADYLHIFLKRPVDMDTVVLLADKTEGWATGIRLLALSLHRVENLDLAQIERLENNYLVEDYLISIILSLQKPDFEECLLQTAVLDHFCAPLCTAVCSADAESDTAFSGEAFIQQLTESNLFVVPLDTQQQWFRYHHLFQDLLLRQLQKRKGKEFIASLHCKASQCFE